MMDDVDFIAGTSVSSWDDGSDEEIKEEVYQEQDRFSTIDQSFINLTIKNYNLKNGLSSRFFDESNEYFGITGPLGKGLGITPESMGVHMVFAAGTGILPFLDLVAKMILQYCDALNTKDERLHTNFKLVMYISFPNKKDSIALPLMQGLEKLVKDKGLDKVFRITYRFHDLQTVLNKLPRWDREYVKTQLETYQSEGI